MRNYERFFKKKYDKTDEVGEAIRIRKLKKSLYWQIQIVGWIMVVLAVIALILILSQPVL